MRGRRRGLLRATAAVALTGLAVAGWGVMRHERLAPRRAWLGAYVEPARPDRAGQQAAVVAAEEQLGARLDVVQWFYPWTSSFPTWREPWAAGGGRRNLITWGAGPTEAIAAGRFDGLIDRRARALRDLGRPVLLRWFAEMDGGDRRRLAPTPASYIAAWRRIHDRFVRTGARNVEMVWCPNASAFGTGEAGRWYPGDDAVEWLCADGYSWAPRLPGERWTPFAELFAAFHRWGRARGKPMLVGETGALEDPRRPGRKAAWIREMGESLAGDLSGIDAVVWFDAEEAPRFAPGDEFDFRIATSPAAVEAWRQVARSAPFAG